MKNHLIKGSDRNSLELVQKVLNEDAALRKLSIDQLYGIIHEKLDQRGTLDKFRGHIKFKVALTLAWVEAIKMANSLEGRPYQEVNQKVMAAAEGRLVDDLIKMGVKVGVKSELSAEEFSNKPHLFFSTHQGGGMETYVLAELMKRGGAKQFRYLMKDENVKLPLVGKTIAGRGPILVSRKNIKEDRTAEINKVAEEIAEVMAGGESVLFFFEGTRSKSGLIAHTENRQKWGQDLNAAIEKTALKYPNLDYGKVLVILDMLSLLPEPLEKNPFGQIRDNADCSVTMVKADNLSFEVSENPEDQGTIFGKARVVLKNRLIERIRR